MKSEVRDQKEESRLSDARKNYLRGMAAGGADDFKVTSQCCELQGNFLTVEECEYLLTRTIGKTLRKAIETKARKAFRKETAGEPVDNEAAGLLCSGNLASLCMENYSTLRKALFMCRTEYERGQIEGELEYRFPWGLCK